MTFTVTFTGDEMPRQLLAVKLKVSVPSKVVLLGEYTTVAWVGSVWVIVPSVAGGVGPLLVTFANVRLSLQLSVPERVIVTGVFLPVITSAQFATGLGSPTMILTVAGIDSRVPWTTLKVKLSSPQKLELAGV